MFAIQYTLVAYVIAIKRSSALLIIFYAFFFLHERTNFKTRLLAMVFLTIGLALIAISYHFKDPRKNGHSLFILRTLKKKRFSATAKHRSVFISTKKKDNIKPPT